MKLMVKPFLVLLTAFLVGTLALGQVSAQEESQISEVANVIYTAEDGTEIGGYLAVPEGVDADLMSMTAEAALDGTEEAEEVPTATEEAATTAEASETESDSVEGYPAVLMVHEWWGLNEDMTLMADILAEEGYIVLAVDTYRGGLGTTPGEAMALRNAADPEIVDSDMQAAFDYLASLSYVDAERIGVIGFCYGGGVALRHATQNDQIAATVDLYGETIEDPEGFGALLETGQPVLGIFGSEDQQFPAERVEAFDFALTEADITHEVTVYEGVGHAFVNAETLETSEQAQEAWDQVLTFFEENLDAEEPAAS